MGKLIVQIICKIHYDYIYVWKSITNNGELNNHNHLFYRFFLTSIKSFCIFNQLAATYEHVKIKEQNL